MRLVSSSHKSSLPLCFGFVVLVIAKYRPRSGIGSGNEDNKDDIMNQSAASEIFEDRQDEIVSSSDSESMNVAVKNKTAKEDFTMSAMTFEIIRAMVKQVENDVKRIVELIAPVVQPILRAGDVAWRHLKLVLESLGRTSPPLTAEEHLRR